MTTGQPRPHLPSLPSSPSPLTLLLSPALCVQCVLSLDCQAAPFDPDCRSVVLDEGSSAAYFKFMPR